MEVLCTGLPTPQTMFPVEMIDKYVSRIETSKPSEKLLEGIDEMYQLVKGMKERKEINQRTFVEVQSRLWSTREAMCESLLPVGQRERTGKIF